MNEASKRGMGIVCTVHGSGRRAENIWHLPSTTVLNGPNNESRAVLPTQMQANYLDEELAPKYGIFIGQYGSHKIAGSIEISRPHLN